MAHPRGENVTTPPTLARLHATLNSLTIASSVLDGFAHRNRNQHRGTRWWGPFSMLYRSIRKLSPDLEAAIQRAEVLSSSSSSSSLSSAKRRKTSKEGQCASIRQPELDKFAQRAQWIHDVVAAKAYEAFTQVTADKQFAHLGLVLIGVLAQVEDAIAPFVQNAAETSSDGAASAKPAEVTIKNIKSDITLSNVGISHSLDTDGYDLGVAISRDHFERDDNAKAIAEQTIAQVSKVSLKEDLERDGKVSKDRHRKRGALGVDPPDPDTDKTQFQQLKGSKVKKTKKKKKGGDEFDDLFSSLM